MNQMAGRQGMGVVAIQKMRANNKKACILFSDIKQELKIGRS